MGVCRYKIIFFSTSGRNIKPTAQGNPRISINYHENVNPYFIHNGMVSDGRGMGIRGEWIIVTDTVHEPLNTYMYDQTTSVELSHILHVVQKLVEFSGVGSLTH